MAPSLEPSSAPTLEPTGTPTSAPSIEPSGAPTLEPTYTNEAISQWAGTGDEGLFLTIDSLGLVPGRGFVNFSVTISGKTFQNGEVMIYNDSEWDPL